MSATWQAELEAAAARLLSERPALLATWRDVGGSIGAAEIVRWRVSPPNLIALEAALWAGNPGPLTHAAEQRIIDWREAKLAALNRPRLQTGENRGGAARSNLLSAAKAFSDSRRRSGVMTVEEVSLVLSAQEGMDDDGRCQLLNRMRDAVLEGTLHTLASGGRLVRRNDVNSWLEEIGAPFQWRERPATEPVGVPGEVSRERSESKLTIRRHRILNRDNIFNLAIDKAIGAAGCRDTSAVFAALTELAIQEHPPFTGIVDVKGLHYSDTNRQARVFTKDALRKRLNPTARGARPRP